MADVCLATWARSRPGTLMITGRDIRAQEIAVRPPPGQPDDGLLTGTGFHPWPGAVWREGECTPGVWQCAVAAVGNRSVSANKPCG